MGSSILWVMTAEYPTPEENEFQEKGYVIERSFQGVILRTASWLPVPHASLIQATMNAAACERFGLDPLIATEGGTSGLYEDTFVEFANWGDDDLGIFDELYDIPDDTGRRGEIVNFYAGLLSAVMDGSSPQSQEDVLIKISKILENLGGREFVNKTFARFSQPGKKFLRGLTDEEIMAAYVPPPGVDS